MRRPTIEKEKTIARIMEEKEEEEEDLIELRATEGMVPQRFHKYLKVFEKKNSERMPMRKAWDYAIDLREGFVPKKGKVKSREREGTRICKRSVEERIH